MDGETLRGIVTGISGRKLDPALEAWLPQFAAEIAAVLQKTREVGRSFPADLGPAPVYSLAAETTKGSTGAAGR